MKRGKGGKRRSGARFGTERHCLGGVAAGIECREGELNSHMSDDYARGGGPEDRKRCYRAETGRGKGRDGVLRLGTNRSKDKGGRILKKKTGDEVVKNKMRQRSFSSLRGVGDSVRRNGGLRKPKSCGGCNESV